MARASALNKVGGYALSMALLAIAALVVVPAMIASGGKDAWGAIAAGQAVGAIGAVALTYGWSLTGPSAIATGTEQQRRDEFVSALRVKAALIAPLGVVVSAVAMLVMRDHLALSALGALQALAAGLSANWFFVGLGRPYAFLVLETLPRVLGTAVGIALMWSGSGIVIGLLCQLLGMLLAFAVCTAWVLIGSRRRGSDRSPRLAVRGLLAEHRHGVISILASTSYASAPMILVALLAPAAQPVYALVDKLQRQVNVGLSPAVTVLQGWVPAQGQARVRATRAVRIGALGAVLAGVGMAVCSPLLIRWLGAGEVHVPLTLVVLSALFVGLSLFDSVTAKAVLTALQAIGVVSRATLISAAVGLPLVALGAVFLGAEGALAGVLVGIVLRIAQEVRAVRRILGEHPGGGHPGGEAPTG